MSAAELALVVLGVLGGVVLAFVLVVLSLDLWHWLRWKLPRRNAAIDVGLLLVLNCVNAAILIGCVWIAT